MTNPAQTRFARRCLVLCCIAAFVVAAIGVKLVKLQVVDSFQATVEGVGGRIEGDAIPARRGSIMDAQERMLTNNIQVSELVADRYHLRDPKVVTWGLAYSKARHSQGWDQLSEQEQEKRVKNYRAKLLAQAASKAENRQEFKLAQLLVEEDAGDSRPSSGRDVAHQKLDELYDKDIVEDYIRKHDEYAARVIAPFLEHTTHDEIVQKIRQDGATRPKQRIILAKDMAEDKAEQLKQALQNARIQGFKCETVHKRSYPEPLLLTHVLGYVGRQTEGSQLLTGVSGLEKQLDRYLQGQDGICEYRKDVRGRIIPSKDDRFKPPVHGLNVKLTIDMELQAIVEEELDKALDHYRATRGTIIIVEPRTGSIPALASRPHFNLNTKENMQAGALNYAVQGLYEPGSTFKIVAVTAAVDSGRLNFNSPIDCRTAPVPGSRPVSDAPRSYGTMPVKAVLWKSSNPGAYRIGQAARWPVYKKYLEAFGFRSRTGIDLPSETIGQSQDGSNIVNFSRITYGYSITVTPLQVAMAYAAIANDGVRMKPRLIDSIYSASGSLVEECKPQIAKRVMKPGTAKQLREVLAGVTEPGGTATRAAVDGYRVGGKTGTAHKVKERGGYHDNRYTVSFVGMLPAEDPAFVCLVVIDDPHPRDCKPGGGTIGAPIFKNVATRLASALNIPRNDTISDAAKKGSAPGPSSNTRTRGNRR